MNNYSPIVLFTYNRLDELKQTITALQKNILANESELFIYSDAAKNEEDQEQVKNVRDYLHSINGFKQVHLVERQYNFGLAQSVIEGVSEIIKKYGRVIVLEDDLISSENFLCYMNEALKFYKDDNKIFSIAGYTFPLKSLAKYNKDIYFAVRPASWGWATWEEQWNGIDWEVRDFKKFIKNRKEVKSFNLGGIDMSRMLKHFMEGKNNSWAIRWSYQMYRRNSFCVYPKVSKIQNIGFGEIATNCTGSHIYETKLDVTKNCDFHFHHFAELDVTLAKEFRYQNSYTNKAIKKLHAYIKNIIYPFKT